MEKDSGKIAYELKYYVNAAFKIQVCLTFPKFWNPIIIKGDLCKSHSCKCLCKICMKKLILSMLKLQISFWSIFDSFTELLRQNYFFLLFWQKQPFPNVPKNFAIFTRKHLCWIFFKACVRYFLWNLYFFTKWWPFKKTMKNVGLFSKIKKGSGARFWCTFSAWFFHKNIPYLIL